MHASIPAERGARHIFVPNDFPYWLEPGISHYVLWSEQPVLTKATIDKVERPGFQPHPCDAGAGEQAARLRLCVLDQPTRAPVHPRSPSAHRSTTFTRSRVSTRTRAVSQASLSGRVLQSWAEVEQDVHVRQPVNVLVEMHHPVPARIQACCASVSRRPPSHAPALHAFSVFLSSSTARMLLTMVSMSLSITCRIPHTPTSRLRRSPCQCGRCRSG